MIAVFIVKSFLPVALLVGSDAIRAWRYHIVGKSTFCCQAVDAPNLIQRPTLPTVKTRLRCLYAKRDNRIRVQTFEVLFLAPEAPQMNI